MIAIAPKVYGYIRVSTDRQALSPEAQRLACLEAVRRLGLAVDAWFQDAPVANPDGTWNDAQSARIPRPERPAGKLLVARLCKGDTVLIAKSDRAFRRLSDCVLLLDRWERLGVRLVLCDFPTLMPADDAFQGDAPDDRRLRRGPTQADRAAHPRGVGRPQEEGPGQRTLRRLRLSLREALGPEAR